MNKKLYIGNLAADATEEDLNHNFSTVGKVISTAIIKDRYSTRSKGFGFVEMEQHLSNVSDLFSEKAANCRRFIISNFGFLNPESQTARTVNPVIRADERW